MATNLQLIKSAELTTPASTFKITDCFNDNYDVFKIVVNTMSVDTAVLYASLRLVDNTNTTISTASYDWAYLNMRMWTSFQQISTPNTTYIGDFNTDSRNTSDSQGSVWYIYNPTDTSSYTFAINQNVWHNTGTGGQSFKGIGVLKTTDNITGIEIFLSGAGNIDEAKLSIYGVK